MKIINRTYQVLLMLLIATASSSVAAQQQNGFRADSENQPEGPLAITLDGDPKFKIYGLLDTGCNSGDIVFDAKGVNIPANTYIQNTVTVNGGLYTNEQFLTITTPAIQAPFPIVFADDGGALGAVNAMWPLPVDMPVDISFYLRDGFDGTILYQRDVTLSKCNGGVITSNEIIGQQVSQPTRATFVVQKLFEDGNPAEVNVAIDCNTGQILDQDKTLTPGVPVEFVVTQFTNETLNCSITEETIPGYTPTYVFAEFGLGESETSCEYRLVEDGEQGVCIIINTADPVEVLVTKNWVVEGDNNDVNLNYDLFMDCDDGEIISIDGEEYFFVTEMASGEGPGSEVHTFEVLPLVYTGASCSVDERFYDDAIEVNNGCKNVLVKAGGSPSCTITNTVFFEGIPTLSQYGMAIMALLMLGLGLVGFRRFG